MLTTGIPEVFCTSGRWAGGLGLDSLRPLPPTGRYLPLSYSSAAAVLELCHFRLPEPPARRGPGSSVASFLSMRNLAREIIPGLSHRAGGVSKGMHPGIRWQQQQRGQQQVRQRWAGPRLGPQTSLRPALPPGRRIEWGAQSTLISARVCKGSHGERGQAHPQSASVQGSIRACRGGRHACVGGFSGQSSAPSLAQPSSRLVCRAWGP